MRLGGGFFILVFRLACTLLSLIVNLIMAGFVLLCDGVVFAATILLNLVVNGYQLLEGILLFDDDALEVDDQVGDIWINIVVLCHLKGTRKKKHILDVVGVGHGFWGKAENFFL